MTITEFLKDHVPFLKGLDEEKAHELAKAAKQLSFGKGKTIIFKGVSVEGLHVVAQGKVSVHVKAPPKGNWMQVAELGIGEVFGERSIVEFTMATATIKSAANDTLLFVLPEGTLTSLMEKDAAFKERTLELIKKRQKDTQEATRPPQKKK